MGVSPSSYSREPGLLQSCSTSFCRQLSHFNLRGQYFQSILQTFELFISIPCSTCQFFWIWTCHEFKHQGHYTSQILKTRLLLMDDWLPQEKQNLLSSKISRKSKLIPSLKISTGTYGKKMEKKSLLMCFSETRIHTCAVLEYQLCMCGKDFCV